MPPRIPDYIRRRIISLKEAGNSNVKIHEILKSEALRVNYNSISYIIGKYKKDGQVADRHRSGRPTEIDPRVPDIIDRHLKLNDELTAKDLQEIIRGEIGSNVSIASIKRKRKEVGWITSGTRYCQLIRKANQQKRLSFAVKCLADNEQFQNVIFTDECTVELSHHAKLSFRKVNDPNYNRKLKPKAKHPLKVHVWAGISTAGATPILIFRGIMDSEFYVKEILEGTLLPFLSHTFPDGNYRFCQDNDPKHRSRLAMQFMSDNNVKYWQTPPESPDLNPIENLWHELKHFLRKVSEFNT